MNSVLLIITLLNGPATVDFEIVKIDNHPDQDVNITACLSLAEQIRAISNWGASCFWPGKES